MILYYRTLPMKQIKNLQFHDFKAVLNLTGNVIPGSQTYTSLAVFFTFRDVLHYNVSSIYVSNKNTIMVQPMFNKNCQIMFGNIFVET